jgi:hypothetical protein
MNSRNNFSRLNDINIPNAVREKHSAVLWQLSLHKQRIHKIAREQETLFLWNTIWRTNGGTNKTYEYRKCFSLLPESQNMTNENLRGRYNSRWAVITQWTKKNYWKFQLNSDFIFGIKKKCILNCFTPLNLRPAAYWTEKTLKNK